MAPKVVRAFSEHDVDLVRRTFEAFLRGDADTAFASIAPEVEIIDHDLPDAGRYRGLEGVARWQADWEASWEEWRWEPQEFIDASETVVVVLRTLARGHGSGVAVDRLDAAVVGVQGGMVASIEYYGSREEALRAAGLQQG